MNKVEKFANDMELAGMQRVSFINRVGTYVSNGASHSEQLFKQVLKELNSKR